MLNLESIKQSVCTDEKVVKIKAWGGEVKIRPLTIAERIKATEVFQQSSETTNVKIVDVLEAQILTAHFALVEPKLSIAEIKELPEEAYAGIRQISEEVEKLNAKK
ncbi:hypothetical protein [Campylobacter sp. RM16190]|uniref:hypothetical protein n=1 Tax=Campylobacter sp. RM16190 TaxID=1705727 RepID=UPI0014729D82|nr:hypothetical protein [Campylobacter sp. RM16190]